MHQGWHGHCMAKPVQIEDLAGVEVHARPQALFAEI
jgi:hypothetical protein